MQDILEDTMRFKDNTPNAKVIVQLQELSLNLNNCFTKDSEEHDKVGGDWKVLGLVEQRIAVRTHSLSHVL